MKNKPVGPLLRGLQWPLILLAVTMIVYGLATSLAANWYSSQAMRGLITAGAYRSRLAAFEQSAGLIAGLLLLLLFIVCAVRSAGAVRTAFAIGAVGAFAPMLTGRAEGLLFNTIGLPTMSAGSVLAGAVVTLVFTLPATIMFIILASSRRVPRAARWVALAAIFIVLATAFFPIYVTVLAFMLKPGDPAVGRMMEVSAQVMKLRYLLPGIALLAISWISLQFARQRSAPVDGVSAA